MINPSTVKSVNQRVSNKGEGATSGASIAPSSGARIQASFKGESAEASRPRRDGTEPVSRRVTKAAKPPPRRDGARSETAAESGEDLPDVAVASFGAPVLPPFVVIGEDDRRQITNTASYPWRAHASLLITARDGSKWIGTGWFISPRTLITAGHCVFIHGNAPAREGWAQSIDVMPGRDATSLPYGSVTSTEFHSVRGWTEDGKADYDYGAIILPTPLGSTVGWFGFGSYDDADLAAAELNISGYPGDKPSGTQWYHHRKTKSADTLRVFYEIDTAGGQSGSAVYRIKRGARIAVAIHAYGDSSSNSGTRITPAVYDNLLAWRAA